MTVQVEKTLVIVFLIVFSTLGILGYTIRDAEPKKIVLPSQAGTVIFDHVIHVEQELDCDICHHTIKEETEKPKSCKKCHNAQKKGSDIAPSDAFHGSCGECHDEVEGSAEDCKMCHKSIGKED